MTWEDLPWNPNDPSFMESEEAMVDYNGRVVSGASSRGHDQRVISAVNSNFQADEEAHNSDYRLSCVLDNLVCVKAVKSRRAPSSTDPMQLVKKWKIPYSAAKRTVKFTTNRMKKTVLHPSLSRRFRTNDRALRYNRLRHDIYSDTLISGTKSWKRQNKHAQTFATRFGWVRAYPMQKKGHAHQALSMLFQQCGVPPVMIVDYSKEQTEGEFRRKCQEAQCRLKPLEPYTPKANAAESLGVRELKKGTRRKMISSGSPKRLWDHCIELEALIRSHTSSEIFMLNGETPETYMTGQTADISQLCELGWYEHVMFRDTAVTYPEDNEVLGRWLGPAIDVGPAMTAKILKSNGEVVYRTTFRALTPEEVEDETHQTMRQLFDARIQGTIGNPACDEDFDNIPDSETPSFDVYFDEVQPQPTAPDEDEGELLMGIFGDVGEVELPTPEADDEYVNVTITLPRGGGSSRGRVVSRKRDGDGNPIGRKSANAAVDSRMYNVEFADGEVTELTANIIATTMIANCDEEGNEYLLLDSIVDFRRDDAKALSIKDQKAVRNDRVYMKKSTKGWELCCKWKDESTSYEPLSLLKESHPVQTAEFAVAAGIDDQPAFNWWVKAVLRRRDRIIAQVKSRQTRYLKKRFKFGIEVPKTIKEAYAIDKKNGNTKWADSIAKELRNVKVAFKILDQDDRVPIGYQQIRMHWIFDIKMEDFRFKSRIVAAGNMTEPPTSVTYATVVSRETVRIALTMAALNNLDVKAGDIQNAYITAPCAEKIWTTLGPEFGIDQGKRAIIVRALYGLRSSGASFRNHLADCMRHLGYTSCPAEPDLWMKQVVRPEYANDSDPGDIEAGKDAQKKKPSKKEKKKQRNKDDGDKMYWSYVLCYVDDILCIHHDPLSVMTRLDKYFKFKPGSISEPNIYLGTKLKKMTLENGVECWASSPSKYVEEAVRNVEKYLKDLDSDRWKLPKRAENPFAMACEPELDTSPELSPDLASFYMSEIGVLRWMVEIGRIDIGTEVSMLSSHMAMPREGHLDAMLHVFAHVRQKHNSRLALDPTYPLIDEPKFVKYDWTEQYNGAKEPVPANMPRALGKEVDLRLYVDSDHAGEKLTRRSRSGWLIYMQCALIAFHSKRQSTVETSVFGAEFCAMKTGIEALRGIRYKLRMMGIPLTGPSFVYGDNMSVIHNTQRPESTLKKKNCSVAYHFIREAVAMDECRTCHIRTEDNPADLLTKVLFGSKRRRLVRKILYDIYD